MHDALPIVIISIIAAATCVLTFIILYFRTRHRERLALIKYDRDATIFNKEKYPEKSTLKWALLLMASGAGLLIGSFIDNVFGITPGGTFASLLIFGGAALFFYYSHLVRTHEEY